LKKAFVKKIIIPWSKIIFLLAGAAFPADQEFRAAIISTG
jgi:hypothetical protein